MRLVDGALLVVDAIDGVLIETRKAIHDAARKNIPISLVISKCDRLIAELRLPPSDCYSKLQSIIDDVNIAYRRSLHVGEANPRKNAEPHLNPTKGNVCFVSAKHRWAFTLDSFAQKYSEDRGGKINYKAFAQRLWGDVYF